MFAYNVCYIYIFKILCVLLISTFEKDCVLLFEIILRDSLRNVTQSINIGFRHNDFTVITIPNFSVLSSSTSGYISKHHLHAYAPVTGITRCQHNFVAKLGIQV